MTTGTCSRDFCFAPSGECYDGGDPSTCPAFQKPEGEPELTSKDGVGVPWSSASLTPRTLEALSGRSPVRLIGVVGEANVGKTSILGTLYNLVVDGLRVRKGPFAGSWTLHGWETVGHFLRFKDWTSPTFPPHTVVGSERIPGLLHLAWREEAGGGLEELVFTDPPGEWFKRWAEHADDGRAAGARWIAEFAHSFALVVDCGALQSDGAGAALLRHQQLARRLADSAGARRVALVWSKTDKGQPESRDRVEQQARDLFQTVGVFELTVRPDKSTQAAVREEFMRLFRWLSDPYSAGERPLPHPTCRGVTGDQFLRFFGRVRG